jgi:hypothetical protein
VNIQILHMPDDEHQQVDVAVVLNRHVDAPPMVESGSVSNHSVLEQGSTFRHIDQGAGVVVMTSPESVEGNKNDSIANDFTEINSGSSEDLLSDSSSSVDSQSAHMQSGSSLTLRTGLGRFNICVEPKYFMFEGTPSLDTMCYNNIFLW